MGGLLHVCSRGWWSPSLDGPMTLYRVHSHSLVCWGGCNYRFPHNGYSITAEQETTINKMKCYYMPLNSKRLTSVSILSSYTDTHLHLYLNKQLCMQKNPAMTHFISLLVFQCFINLNNLKWTQNVQPTVCTMTGVSEAPFPSNLTQCIRCVSLGNVGPACI